MDKLEEIKKLLESSTQGKWEWKGRIAPDWMPDTWSAMDDLRVQILTPEKDYDFDLSFVLQPMKSGFVEVRNADAELIASAPDYLRLLIPVVEAAIEIREPTVVTDGQTRMECACCGNQIRASIKENQHEDDCAWRVLQKALKALE